VIDEWRKIGLNVTQRMAPTGPWFEAQRAGNFDVVLSGNCQSVVNPLLDVQRYLPSYAANYGQFEDPQAVDLYDKMLRETDPAKQRQLMRAFEKHVLDREAHEIFLLWCTARFPTIPTSKAGRSARAIISIRTWRRSGSTSSERLQRSAGTDQTEEEEAMAFGLRMAVVAVFLPPRQWGRRRPLKRRNAAAP